MLRLVKPTIEHEEKYKEMIREWQQYGGPFVPCIIDYDCKNSIEALDYSDTMKVIKNYSIGSIFDYDQDYFERSDFLFLMDEDELIGMGEVRHNLKPLGINTLGHIACGIRPSKRNQGYAVKAINEMLGLLSQDDIEEAVICCYKENKITPKIAIKLGFEYRNSITSEVSKKEINCYIKNLK